MKMHYNELWALVFNVPGSFEFKEAVVIQAGEAIKKLDINVLYAGVSTFNPDYPEDGAVEHSTDVVTKFVQKYDVEKYVKEAIAEKQKLKK